MVLKNKSRSLHFDKIFASHITDSGLVSPIFKELINRLKKKTTQKRIGKKTKQFFPIAMKILRLISDAKMQFETTARHFTPLD